MRLLCHRRDRRPRDSRGPATAAADGPVAPAFLRETDCLERVAARRHASERALGKR
ncbi:hypothetical protein [Halosimplex marinum]|uniref:hypothetical protein n=1 Tax=Halosimplex marinum TaxID=3396620 RepID=UPI003F56008A